MYEPIVAVILLVAVCIAFYCMGGIVADVIAEMAEEEKNDWSDEE